MIRASSTRVHALLLALCLLLAVPSALAEDDPVAVRVNSQTFTQSEVQTYFDSALANLEAQGRVLSDDELAQMRDDILRSFAETAMMTIKYREFGLETLTTEEEEQVRQLAELYQEQMRSYYALYVMENYDKTEREAATYAPTLMELNGYDDQYFHEQAMSRMRGMKLLNFVANDVVVDDDAVTDYYQTNYVTPDEQKYRYNITQYEKDVLYLGGGSYYTPAGYRLVQYIALAVSGDLTTRLTNAATALSEATALNAAAKKTYDNALLTGDTTDQLLKNHLAALARLNDCQTALDTLRAEALAETADTRAAISEALAKGTDFLALARQYSADQSMPDEGYMINRFSVLWDVTLLETGFELMNIGDISHAAVSDTKVIIVRYAGDIQEGAAPLEGELLTQMRQEALEQAQGIVLKDSVTLWLEQSDVELHPELITLTSPEP